MSGRQPAANAGLELLFEADLACRAGVEEATRAGDREGVLIGSGDGVVSGAKIRGRIRWSFYSANCLFPAIRQGAQIPPGLHVCTTNPRGVVETDDGATIWFDAKGFGLRGYDPSAPATFTILIYYTITNLAALRMPIEKKLYPNWIPALGLAFCLVLAASQRPITIASGLALLAAGFGIRMALHRCWAGPITIESP